MLREPDSTLEEHDQMFVIHNPNAMAWLEIKVTGELVGGGQGGHQKTYIFFTLTKTTKCLNL